MATKPSKPSKRTATMVAMTPWFWNTTSRTCISCHLCLFMLHDGGGTQGDITDKIVDETGENDKTIGHIHAHREVSTRTPLRASNIDARGRTTHTEICQIGQSDIGNFPCRRARRAD